MRRRIKEKPAFVHCALKVLQSDLEYEAAHPGAGGQHEEDVVEEHEVTLALLLTSGRGIQKEICMQKKLQFAYHRDI